MSQSPVTVLRAALVEARKWFHPFDQELAITRIDEALAATQPERSEGMPAGERRRATDAEIAEWVERHNLQRGLSGSGSDNRAACQSKRASTT